MKHVLAIFLCMFLVAPLGAADRVTSSDSAAPESPRIETILTHCPVPDRLSQVSQSDCCKGHKGVCGCRAGKIVCCDNTTSPNCTCHAESGVEN